jgi:hypothetical protein
MRWLDAIRARMRLVFARRAAESRMDEEMRFHVEMEAERLMRERGLSAREAQRQALVTFGGTDKYKEALRDDRGFAWLTGMSLDFRLGFRMLRKYPGLTVVGSLALTFAVAVGAFGFEALNQLANPTLPFEQGDRIVAVRNWDVSRNRAHDAATLPHDFAAWHEDLTTIEELGAFMMVRRNLITAPDDIAPEYVAEISASAFRITGVRPLLGRPLLEGDEHAGAPMVVVIGDDIWNTRFARDPDVVGRDVKLGNTPATIVGVMPEGFAFPYSHSVWTPLRLNVAEYRRGEGPPVTVFGRLAADVTLEQAQAELRAQGERRAAEFPETHEHYRPQVLPFAQSVLDVNVGTLMRTGLYWGPWREIVGVTQELALTNDPELPHSAGIYYPLPADEAVSLYIAVHVKGDPESIAPLLRAHATAADPSLQVSDVKPLDQVAHGDLWLYNFWIRILVLASAMALLLSLAAVYAVMSFSVARRTREIGIRVALGADPRRIVASTLGRHIAHAALGVVVGVGLLVAASGGIGSIRAAAGVATFAAAMLAVVMLAAVVPVRRALNVEPARALKGDE